MHVPRTLLFVPADRRDRIPKALAAGADAVVVDLEDAVPDQGKDQARRDAVEVLGALSDRQGPAVHIRINAFQTPWAQDDLEAVASISATSGVLDGVVVPKTESAAQLRRIDETLSRIEHSARLEEGGLTLLPVVETAAAVLDAAAIAAAGPRVLTLLFGTLDLARELGVRPSVGGRELLTARSHTVLAARAAGLPGPLDGPYGALDDPEGLAASTTASRELGFTGRAVLHPRQIATVNAAFAPSAAELEHARQVVAAHRRAQPTGHGALQLDDGTFVDRPVVEYAAELLRRQSGGTEVPR